MAIKDKHQDALFWFGVLGLVGALLTGLGEGLLQLTPSGDFTDPAYGYFEAISQRRLSIGHWLSIASAPLYIAGYWHLTGRLFPAASKFRLVVFAIMAWTFVLATVWIGQRAMLAVTVQSISAGQASETLLTSLSSLHEPLINVLRIAIFGFSLIWIVYILRGQSDYPKWMAIFSPALLLASIFGLYFMLPNVGWLVLPTAMNTAHAIIFGLSLMTMRRQS